MEVIIQDCIKPETRYKIVQRWRNIQSCIRVGYYARLYKDKKYIKLYTKKWKTINIVQR